MNTSVNTCLSVIRLGSAGMKPKDILQAPRLTQLLCVTARTGDRYVRKSKNVTKPVISWNEKCIFRTGSLSLENEKHAIMLCLNDSGHFNLLSHSKLVISSEGGNGLGKTVYFR